MDPKTGIKTPPRTRINFVWWAAVAAGFVPLAWHVYGRLTGDIDLALATELIVRYFGYYALVFLLASLACTPLRVLFGWAWPAKLRKTFGLFGFFYAAIHLYIYVFYEKGFDLVNLYFKDELGRNLYVTIFGEAWRFPFQLFGMTAFLLLIPLALTSTNWATRKLGGKHWQRLHMLVYVISVLGVIHFYMGIKSNDKTEALIFGAILAVLLGVRVYKRFAPKKKPAQATTGNRIMNEEG